MNRKQLNNQVMNTTIKTIALTFVATSMLLFSSCEKDDDVAKPIISGLELGIGDSHVAYIDEDLHIEAEIEAEGIIDVITVEIHQEEGSSDEIEASYDEFAGLKNTTFHKHVVIPEGTVAGTYHIHITVTDQEGNQTTVEDEISIEELADEKAPEISISLAPESGKSYANGVTITISGTATDNISLEGMVVALVKESDNISDADVTGGNTSVIIMLHTHTFDSKASHTFSASIAVGAANDNNMTPTAITGNNAWRSGNYYILVKCKDAKGNWAYSNHYPIVINL
jgi:hypothetical protein